MSERITRKYSEIVGTIFVDGEWQDQDLLLAIDDLESSLAQAHVDVEALLKVRREYEAHGYHPAGLTRCEHGMSRWMGSHCSCDSHALAALPEHLMRGVSK